MRMRNHLLSTLFLATLTPIAVTLTALPGCLGTSVGNPPGAEVKLAVVGTRGVDAPSLNEAAIDVGDGIVIKEAWVALTEIGLHAAGTCGMEKAPFSSPRTQNWQCRASICQSIWRGAAGAPLGPGRATGEV